MNIKLIRALVCIMPVFVLYSCATYNNNMSSYYNNLRTQNYQKAAQNIEHDRLLKKNRNILLYNLEMGKLARLQNDFVKSNKYFNVADVILETNFKNIGDVAVSNLVNPMMQTYFGEDFEKFMMHYYKALNYAALGLTDDAVVEAKRITLSNNAQYNKFRNKNNRYSQDAFSLNLQGMIYEMASDYNNAFIAYRNAVELYQKNDNKYYNVSIPMQLVQDVMRMSAKMGFTSDLLQYEKLFNTNFNAQTDSSTSELIVFIDEGHAPIKEEKNIFLTGTKDGLTSFNYIDPNGLNSNFNFDYTANGLVGQKYTAIRSLKVSMPSYSVQYSQHQNIQIVLNGKQYAPELAQNINSVAVNILKERFVTELTNAMARQLTKKAVQKGAEHIAESIAKNNNKENDSDTTTAQKEERKVKHEKKAERAGEVAGFLLNMVNTATEKADTRNWQSLPAFVHYVRIPLTAGQNNISLQFNGQQKNIQVDGKAGLQMVGVNLY